MPPPLLLCLLAAVRVVATATTRPLRLPDCHSRPASWTPPRSWANASYCPRLHTIHCKVYDPSGCIQIGDTFFIFPDGAPNNTHYASEDLLHWSPRNHSWFHGLTGGISATPSGFYAHWLGERAVALGDPRAGGLGALDRWNCTAPFSGSTPRGCGAPINGDTLRDPGRALQLEPDGPWLLISAGGGSPNTGPNGQKAGQAGIDLVEMADDTLNDVVHRSGFLRLQSQGGSPMPTGFGGTNLSRPATSSALRYSVWELRRSLRRAACGEKTARPASGCLLRMNGSQAQQLQRL